MKRSAFVVPLLVAALPAFAQTPAPAPSGPSMDVPPMKCDAPTLPSSRMMEDTTIRRRFEREVKTYGDCVKAYVKDRETIAKSMQEAAKANVDAGNKAVNDYNALMKQFNDAAK
jgi:hypothetical protein